MTAMSILAYILYLLSHVSHKQKNFQACKAKGSKQKCIIL